MLHKCIGANSSPFSVRVVMRGSDRNFLASAVQETGRTANESYSSRAFRLCRKSREDRCHALVEIVKFREGMRDNSSPVIASLKKTYSEEIDLRRVPKRTP